MAILEMTAAPTPSANRLRAAAAAAAIAACLPYVALKVAWLSGSSVGSATALGAASLHDGRHTVGNVATLATDFLAVMLALSHRRGQKLVQLGRQRKHVRIGTQPVRARRRRQPKPTDVPPARPRDHQRGDDGCRGTSDDRRPIRTMALKRRLFEAPPGPRPRGQTPVLSEASSTRWSC